MLDSLSILFNCDLKGDLLCDLALCVNFAKLSKKLLLLPPTMLSFRVLTNSNQLNLSQFKLDSKGRRQHQEHHLPEPSALQAAFDCQLIARTSCFINKISNRA